MSRLALYFLGSPRVCLDGATVEIDRRKVVALLAYLAVTGQRHSRDELSELLYGRQDREHGRANLRQTLSLLSGAIGRDRLGTDRLGVWLPSGKGLRFDVVEFRRLLESGHTADMQGDLSAAMNHLDKAVGLLRGEFLSGFYLKDSTAFEDWQLSVQEDLRRQQASALRRLVEIHEVKAQYEQAIAARLASLRSLRSTIPSLRPSIRSCPKHLLQVLNGGPAGLELFLRFPTGISEMEAARPPKFLGDPTSHLPCSRTPAGPPCQALSACRCCPCPNNSKDSRVSYLSRLYRMAFVIAVYASRSGSPLTIQDSLPAVSRTLPDGIGYPQGHAERFPIAFRPPFPSFPWRDIRQSIFEDHLPDYKPGKKNVIQEILRDHFDLFEENRDAHFHCIVLEVGIEEAALSITSVLKIPLSSPRFL